MKVSLAFSNLLFLSIIYGQNLALSSDNEFLVEEFNSAKELAYYYVVTGDDPDYIPAYWGSYPIRECFCSRDICHQAEAGHLLGLDLENFSMLKTFASDAPESNEYWPKWSYDFFGEPYFMDADFKELPAPFEIVEKIYEQYLWTGDPDWIWNDTLFTYCQNTVTHFVNIHDQNANGIAETHTELATYWEQESDDFIEAGDAFANQYQAVLAFAGILEARENIPEANLYFEMAENLRNQHAIEWFDNLEDRYIRGFDADGNYETDFGHENSFFMPMKRITDLDTKTKQYVDFCHKSIAYPNGNEYTQWNFNQGINIEAKTYLPQMGYNNNRIAIGWHWLLNIMNSNSDYPEVPFLIVGNIVAGMMGLTPDAPNNKITTLSKLNYEVPWVQADFISLGETTFSIRHDGQSKTALTHSGGPEIRWEAQFYGIHDQLLINGNLTQASVKSVNGTQVSCTILNILPGQVAIVELPDIPIIGEIFLSDLEWTEANSSNGDVKRDVMSQGYAMAIDGKIYDKGLGVFGDSEITYNLSGQYFRFTSDYGIDDSKTMGSAVFEVWADGVEVFNSGMIYSEDELKTLDMNVSGVNQLILKTTQANNWDGICNWGNARVNTEETPILSVEFTEMTDDDNENGEFDPGESASVHLAIANLGITSESVWINCIIDSDISDFIELDSDFIYIGILESYEQTEIIFNVTIDPAIPRGSVFTLEFILTDGTNSTGDSETFFIPAPDLQLQSNSVQNDDNGNGIPEPGEDFEFHLIVSNLGNFPSQSLTVTAQSTSENNEFLDVLSPTIDLEGLEPDSQADCVEYLSIHPDTPRGTVLELTLVLTDGEFGDSLIHTFTMPFPQIKMEYLGYTNDSNENAVLEAGETAELTIQITNDGTGATDAILIVCESINNNSEQIEILNPEVEIGIIDPGNSVIFVTTVQVNTDAPTNMIFNLIWSYTDGLDFLNLEKSIGTDVLWISDAFWTFDQNGWGETHRDATVQGLPITLNGVVYEKGVGVHAVSEIRIDLNGQFLRFVSDVGIDDEVSNGAGSVEFHVFTNGEERFDSGYMNSDSPTQSVDIDISEVQELKLLVSESTFGISSDHADWAGAHLTPVSSNSVLSVQFINGWNIIGLPLEVENNFYPDIYPEAIDETLYGFDETYYQSDNLLLGNGYWLFFNSQGNVEVVGQPIEELTIGLNENWNLISGISQPVYINDITDPEGLIIPGTLYGYNENGFFESWMIDPGIGYWLRSYGEGNIFFSGAFSGGRQEMKRELNEIPWISINGIKLLLDSDIPSEEIIQFSLPPKPPMGATDIRFSGDTKLCNEDECFIEIMTEETELIIEYNILVNHNEYAKKWILISDVGEKYLLEGRRKINIKTPIQFFEMKKIIPQVHPETFVLHQAFPNPFNPVTTILYDLSKDSEVNVTIYNILGVEIRNLVSGEMPIGFHSVIWDGTGNSGKSVSAGVYLYQIQTKNFSQVRKMVLLK